jgi:hypothetical protein
MMHVELRGVMSLADGTGESLIHGIVTIYESQCVPHYRTLASDTAGRFGGEEDQPR